MKFNTEEFNKLIRERRSVFPVDYSEEKIDDTIIRQMLENANWAPTHKVTEPWRFVVFSGDGLKRLAAFQGECYRKATIANGTFKEDKYKDLTSKPLAASHVIAVVMKRDERKAVSEQEELGAVYCAIENMYLTATAYGLGCYLATGGVTYFEETREFLGFGEEDRMCGFLYVGIPKREIKNGKRKPVEEKSTWIVN